MGLCRAGLPCEPSAASPQDITVRNHGIVVREFAVDRLIEGIIVAGR
jgi:hypothetical protein